LPTKRKSYRKGSKQVAASQIKNSEGAALVEVEWIDSTAPSFGGWSDMDEVREDLEPLICYSAGYVLKLKQDEYIVIAVSIGGAGAQGIITIPWVQVRKIHIHKDER